MTDSEPDSDLASLFQSITGRSEVTERQDEGVSVRTLDATDADAAAVSMDDGLDDAIGNSRSDTSGFDG